jgi:hypothetical protein
MVRMVNQVDRVETGSQVTKESWVHEVTMVVLVWMVLEVTEVKTV